MRGLVQVNSHSVLPDVSPGVALACTLVCAAVSLGVSQGRKRLSEGKWIMLFPEGTRTPRGSTKPYRKGGARLASATGALVIPIAHNAGSVWPKNSFLKYPGTVILSIGPPITSTGKSGEDLQQEVEGWIEAEMRVIDPSAY